MVFHHNSRYVIWWLLFSMQAVLHVICILLVYSAVFGSSMCQFLTQTLCSKFVTNCCPECLGAQNFSSCGLRLNLVNSRARAVLFCCEAFMNGAIQLMLV